MNSISTYFNKFNLKKIDRTNIRNRTFNFEISFDNYDGCWEGTIKTLDERTWNLEERMMKSDDC